MRIYAQLGGFLDSGVCMEEKSFDGALGPLPVTAKIGGGTSNIRSVRFLHEGRRSASTANRDITSRAREETRDRKMCDGSPLKLCWALGK